VESEEVGRKPKDPVVQPAAAIEKKHSDTERVSLPTFMNFPSEQGVAIIPQEGLLEPSKPANYEKVSETVQEEKLTQKIGKTKPLVKALGKKKAPPQEPDTGSPDQSTPIPKPMVTSETVTTMEVLERLLLDISTE
jgi:hypothetical protein